MKRDPLVHVVMYSGGVGSFLAAQRIRHLNPILLFTDTLIEDDDLYRFLDESATYLGLSLVKLADGRTPWQVFRDVRFIGNSRTAPCSHILKQQQARKWIDERFSENPWMVKIYVGIDWTEIHRLDGAIAGWAPYDVEAPLCDKPLVDKADSIAKLPIQPPRLYSLGFAHNNCGGFCVRSGQAQFKHLQRTFPELYTHHEEQEQELREYLQADVSIMKDRRNGNKAGIPLTMRQLRERERVTTSSTSGAAVASLITRCHRKTLRKPAPLSSQMPMKSVLKKCSG